MTAGVQFIHSKNIVHRDIKTENFLVFTRDGKLLVKLSDFGAAKELANLQAGTNTGTFNYMAPERLEKQAVCTIESDVWSLGCVFYEAMTG